MHNQKDFPVKAHSKIERHQLHLSFMFTERYGNHDAYIQQTESVAPIAIVVTSIYITNIHKINWLIMLLSMGRVNSIYTYMYVVCFMQFKCDDSQKFAKWKF